MSLKTVSMMESEAHEKHARIARVLDQNREVIGKLHDFLETTEAVVTTFKVAEYGHHDEFDLSFAGNRATAFAVWGWLRQQGFKPSEYMPSESTTPTAAFATTFYRTIEIDEGKPENDYSKMSIWFCFASTQCRRVKVGTKMVEEDVYETKCAE
jgi:hypothetical protein